MRTRVAYAIASGLTDAPVKTCKWSPNVSGKPSVARQCMTAAGVVAFVQGLGIEKCKPGIRRKGVADTLVVGCLGTQFQARTFGQEPHLELGTRK